MEPSARDAAPACVGIILDGNRRYAKACGISVEEGHKLGYAKVTEAIAWCKEAGIAHVIVYAFSTENWNRSPEEVSSLVSIFRTLIFSEAQDLHAQGGAIRFIGDIARFGKDFQDEAARLQNANPSDPAITVVVALSYGGRSEILHAAQRLLEEKSTGPLREEDFANYLWTAGIPDPDLVIRTGGEKRLSNFLPWQSVYSELFFTDTPWPAFSKEEFMRILKEYSERERRIGR